jgi:hypothetical protein
VRVAKVDAKASRSRADDRLHEAIALRPDDTELIASRLIYATTDAL